MLILRKVKSRYALSILLLLLRLRALVGHRQRNQAHRMAAGSDTIASTITPCPINESTPTEIPSGPVMLVRSSSLCVLTKAIPDANDGTLTRISPVALSYDGQAWEVAAGEFATTLLYGRGFGDDANGSHITLPHLYDDEKYYLTSYSHDISDVDKVARLLETATFGTTAQDLASWDKGSLTTATVKQWIEEQMSMPMTSHREYFRRRTNPRVSEATYDIYLFLWTCLV